MSKKNLELYAQTVLQDMVISATSVSNGDLFKNNGDTLEEVTKFANVNNFSRLMNQMFDKNSSSPVVLREQQQQSQLPKIAHSNNDIQVSNKTKIVQSSSPVIQGSRFLRVTAGFRSPFQINSQQFINGNALKITNSNYFSMNLKKINGLDNDFVENRAWSLGPPIMSMSQNNSNLILSPNRSLDSENQELAQISVKNFSFLTRNFH